jgi:hypothetical protein
MAISQNDFFKFFNTFFLVPSKGLIKLYTKIDSKKFYTKKKNAKRIKYSTF